MTIKNNWMTTSLSERTPENLCDFSITINPYPFVADSFENNSKRVAREICEKNEKVYVLYSGGIDSEYVLKVFLEEKLPVIPVLVVTPYNKLELEYAVKFCVENKLKPFILKFEKREMFNIMQKKCSEKGYFSFIAGLHLHICDIISEKNGIVVTGYGEPFATSAGPTYKEDINSLINLVEVDFYDQYHSGNHVGSFYTYDIALQYSILTDIVYNGNIQAMKCKLYKVPYRQKIYWDREFYIVFNALKDPSIKLGEIQISLEKYKSSFLKKEPTTFYASV
jgi:hypothetical protein